MIQRSLIERIEAEDIWLRKRWNLVQEQLQGLVTDYPATWMVGLEWDKQFLERFLFWSQELSHTWDMISARIKAQTLTEGSNDGTNGTGRGVDGREGEGTSVATDTGSGTDAR